MEDFSAAADYGIKFSSTGQPTYRPTIKNRIPDWIDIFDLRILKGNLIQEQNKQIKNKTITSSEIKTCRSTFMNSFQIALNAVY